MALPAISTQEQAASLSIHRLLYEDVRLTPNEQSELAHEHQVKQIFSRYREVVGNFSLFLLEFEVNRKFTFLQVVAGKELSTHVWRVKYLIIRLMKAKLWDVCTTKLDALKPVQVAACEKEGRLSWLEYPEKARLADSKAAGDWTNEVKETLVAPFAEDETLQEAAYCRKKRMAVDMMALDIAKLQDRERLAYASFLILKRKLEGLSREELGNLDTIERHFGSGSLPSLQQALREAATHAVRRDAQLVKRGMLQEDECESRRAKRELFIQKQNSSLSSSQKVLLPPGFENLETLFLGELREELKSLQAKNQAHLEEIRILESGSGRYSLHTQEIDELFTMVAESCYPLNSQMFTSIFEYAVTGIESADSNRIMQTRKKNRTIPDGVTEDVKQLYRFGFEPRYGIFLFHKVEWAHLEYDSKAKVPQIIMFYVSVAKPGGRYVQLELKLDLKSLNIQSQEDLIHVASCIRGYLEGETARAVQVHGEKMRKKSPIVSEDHSSLEARAEEFAKRFDVGLMRILMLVNNPQVGRSNVAFTNIRIRSQKDVLDMVKTLERLTSKVTTLLFCDSQASIISWYQEQLDALIRPLVEIQQTAELEQFLDFCLEAHKKAVQLVRQEKDEFVYSTVDSLIRDSYDKCRRKLSRKFLPLLHAVRQVCCPTGMQWVPDIFSLAHNPTPSRDHHAYVAYLAQADNLVQKVKEHPYHEQVFVGSFMKTGLFTWHKAEWRREKSGALALAIAAAVPGFRVIEVHIDLQLSSLAAVPQEAQGVIFEYLEEVCKMPGSYANKSVSKTDASKRREKLEKLQVDIETLDREAEAFKKALTRSLNILSTMFGNAGVSELDMYMDITEAFTDAASRLALKELQKFGWSDERETVYFHNEVMVRILNDAESIRRLYQLIRAAQEFDHELAKKTKESFDAFIAQAVDSFVSYIVAKGFSKKHEPIFRKKLGELLASIEPKAAVAQVQAKFTALQIKDE